MLYERQFAGYRVTRKYRVEWTNSNHAIFLKSVLISLLGKAIAGPQPEEGYSETFDSSKSEEEELGAVNVHTDHADKVLTLVGI